MSKALATKNVAAVLVGTGLIIGSLFAFANPAKAATTADLQAQVQALLAQIAALQGGTSTSGTTTTVPSSSCHTFTRNQKVGDKGGEVMWIQQFLNSSPDTQIASTGAGSPGNETSYFGNATKAAVKKFQEKYTADILTPVGLTKGTGTWGASSRAKANALCSSTSTGTTGGTTGGTTTTTGGNITVAAGTQPANTLAPAGAVRVPFTTFTLTNNSGAAVTVNGITVQRTGLAQDNNFAGVVLVDSNGLQLGNSQSFDSNHNATIGGTFTLQPGTQTFTVAGNIANGPSNTPAGLAHSGEVPSITVTGVNTTGTVSGSLPISGASQTINTTLSIGTISASNSSYDPNGQTKKNIGDTAIRFSGVRFTAGSGEDVKFFSIRWRVNGSASPSDLGNVVTYVNGTSYPTTVSSDGRYYTSTFPGGILLTKGNAVDVYVQGDIVGSNASGRNIEFDIDRAYDVYFVGQTYGYGIGLGTSAGGTYSTLMPHDTGYDTAKQPWFSGSTVTIQGGTVTTIQNATSVGSQNIAVNVPNVVLGGFQTNFAGEPVTVQGMTFTYAASGSGFSSTNGITLVSIVDENGAVIAGPIDATSLSSTGGTVAFTNSVTFPTGVHTYTLKGKVPSSVQNGATIQFSTNPSGGGWVSPQGQQSGNQVSLSGITSFPLNMMTVRGANLTISAAQTPSSQSIVAGGQNITFANIQLDASQSGEDVQLSSLPITLKTNDGGGNPAVGFLSTCQLWDGTTALNTSSDVKNSLLGGTSGSSNPFTFTQGSLKVPKGTVKTLALTCSLSSSATSSTANYQFGVDSLGTPTVIGVQSGTSLTSGTNLTVSPSYSGVMTVSSGATVTAGIDASTPSYAVQTAGTTGVVVGVIKLHATNEAFNLTKLGLTTGNSVFGKTGATTPVAGTAAGDLVQVTLWNGSTQIGTAIFTGANTTATSTLTNSLNIPVDADTLITVKADLARIGTSQSGGIGDVIKVDPLNFEGTGVSSGKTIKGNATGSVNGVQLFKSFPTLALDTLGSNGVVDGRLLRFKVTATSAGPVNIGSFGINVTPSSASVMNIQLFGFNASDYSSAASTGQSGGQIGTSFATTTAITGSTDYKFVPAVPVQVPASGTYYFELRGSVTGSASNYSVVAKLTGDQSAAVPQSGYKVNTVAALTSTTTPSNFIWSGNSTTTAAATDIDWSNGFSIPGLPSSGLIQTRSN